MLSIIAQTAAATPAPDSGGLGSTVESLLQQLPEWGMKIIGILALFIVGRWLAGKLGRAVQRTLEKRDFDATLSRFFGTMVRTLVLVVVVLACLSIFGIETTSVAAVIGAAAFAVGLALQGSLANFAAGVMLVVFRPYKVGDFVQVSGQLGTVETLGLFTTTLDTPDNRRIIIPNAQIFSGTIENLTHNDRRRADVPVGVDYTADLDVTRKVLEGAIPNVASRIVDAPHQVFLANLGGSSVDWQVRVWCKSADFGTCRQQTVAATKKALDAAGISIPFPQLDVHLDKA
ncbi:MAG: mechanosensitive ion channel protein [Deltaproteobacteria bacterium HGW-Deltaproteobacteria-14]|jgi:small conductance mechanosensitive channel|nr:MAG: mechanosensitive ion channel protein [Deltaproteobacteria bacterium HGW-Deltaproteobacteria-14]